MLEHTSEGNHLSATLIDTVTDNLIDWVVSRGNICESTVFSSLLHPYLLNIKTIIDLEIVAHMGHIEGIETGLSLTESRFHFRHLKHLRGMIGRHTERLTTIDNVFTKTQCQRGNTFLGCLLANGIIVERAKHTREVGIIEIAIAFAHHFLQNHGHLLLINDVRCRCHISL